MLLLSYYHISYYHISCEIDSNAIAHLKQVHLTKGMALFIFHQDDARFNAI